MGIMGEIHTECEANHGTCQGAQSVTVFEPIAEVM
jgi:hypothetical protein